MLNREIMYKFCKRAFVLMHKRGTFFKILAISAISHFLLAIFIEVKYNMTRAFNGRTGPLRGEAREGKSGGKGPSDKGV